MRRKCLLFLLALLLTFNLLFSQISVKNSNAKRNNSEVEISALTRIAEHVGDLIVDNDEELLIENATIEFIDANIYVRDRGRLIVRNSTFITPSGLHGEYNIHVEDEAVFEAENLTILRGSEPPWEGWGEIRIKDNATLDFRNVIFKETGIGFAPLMYEPFYGTILLSNVRAGDFSGISISFNPSSTPTIYISNSELGDFCLRFWGGFEGSFTDLKTGLWQNWTYKEGTYDITVENTWIYNAVGISCDASLPPSNIVINNSNIFQFSGDLTNGGFDLTAINSTIYLAVLHPLEDDVPVKMFDLRPGFYEYWSLDDHIITSIPGNIIFRNSTVEGWLISVFGDTHFTLENSTLHELRTYGTENGRIDVEDSDLGGIMFYYSKSTLTFDQATIGYLDVYLPSNAYLTGNITFLPDAYIYRWIQSNITRNYNVQVLNVDGSPMEDASLRLFDYDGSLMWSGYTNTGGKANFNLTFMDSNYTTTLTLEANGEGCNSMVDVSLLSDTPIQLYLPQAYEIDLVEGWNLISLPLIPDNSRIEAVLADVLEFVEKVWSYDAVTEVWSSYVPGAPSNLDEMVEVRGYWIRMTEDATLTVRGEYANTRELALFEGWNLIGLPLTPEDPSIEVVLADILDDVNSVWTFDGETKTWSSYSPRAPSDLTEMVEGRGYWIKVNTDAILTIYGDSE